MEHLLDVRFLEPPQPLERVIQALRVLRYGDSIRMVHRREPCLLFPILQRDGFAFKSRVVADDHVEIVIWHLQDDEPT